MPGSDRLAFEEMSTGNFTQEEVRKQLNSRGLTCSKNYFNKIIRNPFYAGRPFVPSFKDETECFVKAAHKPIISEMLFYRVQDVIKGSRPLNTTKNTCRIEFPLRGFLQCCKCGKILTGSTGLSKHKRKYYYYHCTKGCSEIYSTKRVHDAFEEVLRSVVANKI